MSLIFNTLPTFVIAFLLRSKSLLISWLQSLSAVILEPKKIWSVTASIFSTSICHEVMGLDAMILLFWMLSFKPAFSLCSFTSSRGSSVPLHFLPLEWYQLYISGCWYFSQLSWFQLELYPAGHFSWCTLHISRVTIYSLDIFLSQFGTSPLFHGEGNGNPLQYSCLENPVDRGAWWAAVYGVGQSCTRLKWLSTHACIGEGNGNPLQHSCLENPRDRGALWAAIYGVSQSWTWLKQLSSSSRSSMFIYLYHIF